MQLSQHGQKAYLFLKYFVDLQVVLPYLNHHTVALVYSLTVIIVVCIL